jgi:hypothetical protein
LEVDRFGVPRVDGRLAACGADCTTLSARRFVVVARNAAVVAHLVAVGALPADPGVLHHVIRIRRAVERPIGDPEQSRTHGLERRRVDGRNGRRRLGRHDGPSVAATMKLKRSNAGSLAISSSANICATSRDRARFARGVAGLRIVVCSTEHASDELVDRLCIALGERGARVTVDRSAAVLGHR